MRFIPYARQSIDSSDIKRVIDVLKSDYITQGPKIEEFETGLASYCGAKYAVCASSGTAALHIACLAAGIASGDKVITSPLTFAASANCVLYCGGVPVFADVEKDTINIDPREIKKKLAKKTRALIPVHFAGHPCDLKEIRDIANRRNLILIEDAAHALGAKYRDSKIGSCRYSDMTIFSFHPAKHITTGEGGAVLTNRRDLYRRLLMFRNHGITKDSPRFKIPDSRLIGAWYYEMQELGFNYRITDIQCALGLSQFKKLGKFLKRREGIVNLYSSRLKDVPDIDLPSERPYVNSSWHLYCIRLKNANIRKLLFDGLRGQGIGVQVHYIPVYKHPYYRKLGYRENLCQNAENFYQRTISLPLYESISLKEADYVVDKILGILKNARGKS